MIVRSVPKNQQFQLINEKKRLKKGRKYSNSGTLVISGRLFSIPTFLDFIAGKTELEFTVAIDFTASNQAPHDPNSLHYISSHPNQYEVAIRWVLSLSLFTLAFTDQYWTSASTTTVPNSSTPTVLEPSVLVTPL